MQPEAATISLKEESRTSTPRSLFPAIRVILADDHAIFRQGLRLLLSAHLDMIVVGEAENGRQAWELVEELQAESSIKGVLSRTADIVIMDISMPEWNGIEATRQIKRNWPRVLVLALSTHEDKSYLRSILEAGASGYILKRSASEELIRAVRAVASGETYLDPALSAVMTDVLARVPTATISARGAITGARLSERENNVLRMIAQGYTNKEIAVQLKISIKTVETYKARCMEKLALGSRVDIVRYAMQKGWLDPRID